MMMKVSADFYVVTIVSVSKYLGNLRSGVNMVQLRGANFRAVTLISVSKYLGTGCYMLTSQLWRQDLCLDVRFHIMDHTYCSAWLNGLSEKISKMSCWLMWMRLAR